MVHGSLELFEQRHYGTLLLLVYVCSLLRMACFCLLAQCEQAPRLPCHLKIKSKTKIIFNMKIPFRVVTSLDGINSWSIQRLLRE